MNFDEHNKGFHFEFVLALPFGMIIALYMILAIVTSRRYKPFPLHRYFCWIFGVLSVAASVVGPLAGQAHHNFTAHMMVHLLLGMLAPLLLTLAAPMTLLFRTLSLKAARRLARLLRSPLFRVFINTMTASILNIGGLWVLYATDLYNMMQQSLLLHVLIHIHVFLAGYLFTASMIYIDPAPHRTSFVYRSIMMILALSGHSILSKHLYSNPPSGVPVTQAEIGSMIMYYGGDIIDMVLITTLFFQWFKATRPQAALNPQIHN